ncbi:hypothetical protein GMORB2_2573 [Geosmithia morbida]|uniref:Carboxypeptidase n=1 Tax=Geosmithia morbida TaxID=1094350 RepID=A0A9P4YQ62_9HYPO|nr:uncharacterized protein GMORB2_2573 [Geosmithia morbida]KAF4121086.1 hypothetical protein GMORB2_2573 [Geosmithia morbida]
MVLPTMRLWSAALALTLWPAAAIAEPSAADYYVRDLPGVPEDASPIKMHAGHIEVNPEHHGNLFFWHFQNAHIANRQRTVIWINGGPGCSSEDGALMEIGPYRVKDKDHLVLNNGSWNEFANLLFVDNPVGTGFSYVDTDSYIHELDTMAEHFLIFLEKFFAMFPHYELDDLYIAGESYAGQHIPYIARAILDRNKKEKDRQWNLKGLVIGNGWISPDHQYDAYLDYGYEKGLLKKGSDLDRDLQADLVKCKELIAGDPGHVDYGKCEKILSKMLYGLRDGSGNEECINMYDIRLRDSYPTCGMSWPPDLEHVEPYLQRREVTEALHVNPQRNMGWTECNGNVGNAFNAKNSRPSFELLPGLMEEQLPILLFSGAEDLICNHLGTEALINDLEWSGGKGFELSPGNWAPRRNWTFEGESAGFWQEARNLTYVLFNDASHMVPFDWPRRSRDMLDRFMMVDVSSIGGEPSDSHIDGEKLPETAVGDSKGEDHDDGDHDEHDEHDDDDDDDDDEHDHAKWEAYRRSGSIVLVIVIVATIAWGYFVWTQRRSSRGSSGAGAASYHSLGGATEMRGIRRKPGEGDLEASAFGESEDNLNAPTGSSRGGGGKYTIGDESDDDEKPPKVNSGPGVYVVK